MNAPTRHPLSRALPTHPAGPMRVPARALGWFGIGLGLIELAMPRTLARSAGMPSLPTLTRACGLREIGAGIGILTSRDPTPWLWARVAGDALDVVTVSTGLLTQRRPLRTMATVVMLLGIAYVDKRVAEAAPPDKKRGSEACATTARARDFRGQPKRCAELPSSRAARCHGPRKGCVSVRKQAWRHRPPDRAQMRPGGLLAAGVIDHST